VHFNAHINHKFQVLNNSTALLKDLKPSTLAGFEPTIFCSEGGPLCQAARQGN
jgi:hypothetical protein